MKKWLFASTVVVFFISALVGPVALYGSEPATDAATESLAIHFIAGAKEYDAVESMKLLKRHLEGRYRVTCTASWAADGAERLDNLDALAKAEVLVLFARRFNLQPDSMKLVRKHWEQGKPIVAIRTASHAFSRAENEVFDRKVLGGNYQGHYGEAAVKVTSVAEQKEHPVLAGVGEFKSSKLYKAGPLAESATVLQYGETAQATEPVTHVHNYGGGRNFYTSAGTADDFKNADFVRLLENAVFWTAEKEPTAWRRPKRQ